MFLLCAEGLGALIKKAHQNNFIHGISIARGAPFLTHLFFAGDSLVFARANAREAKVILEILKEYESLSSQMVNYDKCEVSFSKSLSHEIVHQVSSIMGFKKVVSHDKYLGLPTLFRDLR